MKKVNQTIQLIFLFSILILTSCSQDSSTEELLTSAADYSLDIEIVEENNSTRSDIVDVKITYYSSVSEGRKTKIRQHYVDLDILLDWTPCDDEFSEIWYINCPLCKKDSDLPIKTDDCEDEESDCDVKRAAIFEPCKNED